MSITSKNPRPPLPKCPGIVRGQRYSTNHAAVTIDGRRLNWQDSLALRNHSPTGIEWGYMGSGPTQLALALLLQITDQETALNYYQRFKNGAIARIATDRWATTTNDVIGWLKRARTSRGAVHLDVSPDDTGPRQTVAWEWARRETQRRRDDERTDPVLAPPEAFPDEYHTFPDLARINPDADHNATGPRSQTIRGLLCGACAGWKQPPDSIELYNAMRAMREANPTRRQLSIAGVLINEASFEDLVNAHLEGAFTWRQAAIAAHLRGHVPPDRVRLLNAFRLPEPRTEPRWRT